ncbi:MAG: biosynthetic-type acetolactate synthase large subunit [Longimicrobiales bacterium]
MRTTGADILCRALHAEGARVLFGHPGGAILPFYDALHRDGRLRHVLVRHEQGAAHAADGYSRATGEVGVCVSTSGPGATNLVTGLATAMADSVPVVALTGQVSRAALGTEAFQETDILGITAPVTKYGFLPASADEIPGIVAEAFKLARSGRPGPVLVDLPKDLQNEPVSEGVRASLACSGPAAPQAADAPADSVAYAMIRRAAALVDKAERPVLMVGRGILLAGMVETVRRLAEWAELPVATSLLGLDAFPAGHPLALGLPGMHGTPRANRAIHAADVILGLGLRFDDRIVGRAEDFAPHARIVHFDIDPSVIGRTLRPEVSVRGDLAETLPLLTALVRPRARPEWMRRLQGWEREAEPLVPAPAEGLPHGRTVLRVVAGEISRARGIVVTDVGQHQMWMAQELADIEPRSHLTSGGMGTMGYSLPAAIGAAVGCPGRDVWVVAGDGGFQMTLHELATAVQERCRLRVVVVNNGYLGMVRQWQEHFYESRYSASEITGPDFAALAQAYGIPARTVACGAALGDAVAWAGAADGPVLLDLRVAREDNVYPFVPAGTPLHEFVTASRAAVS